MSTSLLPIRFRTELARQFMRNFTNTITVSTAERNSLTPLQNTLYTFTATAGQTVFTGNDDNGNSLTYLPGRIQVFLNGQRLADTEFTAVDKTTIELAAASLAGDVLTVAEVDIYSFPNPTDYHYIFLGRTVSWDNENIPPTPTDTRRNEADTKRNILAVKRVQPNDVSLLIKRVDWQQGVIYDSYTDDVDIKDRNFYVMNPNTYRVYKCVYSPGIPSINIPNRTSPGPIREEDGYYWQLMYEIPAADRVKFLTADYIPVKFFSTSSTFDSNALIDDITIINGGSGYTSPPVVLILGDGVGAIATATVAGGTITSVNIVNPGSGYSFALVQVVGGGGAGAELEVSLRAADLPLKTNQDVASYAISTAGAINNIVVVNGGSNYLEQNTRLVISGDGTGAKATAIVNSEGQITGATLDQRGTGYTFADIIVVTDDGEGAELRAVIEPEGGHGSDIPKELFANTVAVSVNVEDLLTDFFLNNDFRQVGLIKNIKDFYENEVFSSPTGTPCYVITAPDPTKYSIDDVVTTDTEGKYIVVNKKGNRISLLPIIDSINESSLITNNGNTLTFTGLTIPEISRYSGDIIYTRNVSPVTRLVGQAEQLKLYFSF